MGGLLGLNLAITLGLYWNKLDSDEWNWDDAVAEMIDHINPASPRFFTWDIGGRNIGPGGKVRSLVKLIGQSYDAPSSLDPRNIELSEWGMNNPAIRFLRGSLAPVPSSATDLLSGYTYVGDPTRGEIGDLQGWTEALPKVLLPDVMPIWVQAVLLEGGLLTPGVLKREWETGQLGGRLTGAAVEFFGGRGSPLTQTQSMQELHREDPETRDTPWEDLSDYQKEQYREAVEVKMGGPVRRGRTGPWHEKLDELKAVAVQDMLKHVEPHLQETPFGPEHMPGAAKNNLRIIEGARYNEASKVYPEIYPSRTRDEPEDKDSRKHIEWRYYSMFDKATATEDVADPITGEITLKAGEIDHELFDRLEAKLWGSLNRDEATWLLDSIREGEWDYPPATQRMKQAIRWLGIAKVDLDGISTGYWDILDHPAIREDMRRQVPELSNAEIAAWLGGGLSIKRDLERGNDNYGKLARVKSRMETGDGIKMGLIKQFKRDFLVKAEQAHPGWYYTMVKYGYQVYGETRAIPVMRAAYGAGEPVPDVPYQELHREYIRAMARAGIQ